MHLNICWILLSLQHPLSSSASSLTPSLSLALLWVAGLSDLYRHSTTDVVFFPVLSSGFNQWTDYPATMHRVNGVVVAWVVAIQKFRIT
ncbi:hypothetical protein BKA70DRAFT_1329319 [Coprinopsis sp. MPI-PUGE-AT-0042]|nr:hypothetical protein BKA70DRAFT_1329319 [Coprinopsis sp. MPI-PUGE-AT-0042]